MKEDINYTKWILISICLLLLLIFKNSISGSGALFIIFVSIMICKKYYKIKRYKGMMDSFNKKNHIFMEEEIKLKVKTTRGESLIAVSFIDENSVAKHFLGSTKSGEQIKISAIENMGKVIYTDGWK